MSLSEFQYFAIHDYIDLVAPPDDQFYSRLAIYNSADVFANNIVSLFVIFTISCLVSFVKFRHFPYFFST